MTTPSVHYLALLPELILTVAALGLLVATALTRGRLSPAVGTATTVLASAACLVVAFFQWHDIALHGASTTVAHAIILDGFAVVATAVIAITLGLSILVCDGWLARERITGVELHLLAMISAAGAVLMVQANDLVVIFLGLEILSIALYVLAAFDARSPRGGEAAMKYFILGGFSSAVFVYGIALVYGATGTTQLAQLSSFLSQNLLKNDGLLLAGTALLLAGFAFKIAAVPFHVWSPDVYEGAPTPVTGYMASAVKVGAFAAALRVLASGLFTQQAGWRPMVWALAALSMLVGAGLATVQRNVKRLLAYSSIYNAGFMLMGLWAASSRGTAATLYYVMIYALLIVGSFAVVTVASADGREDLTDYRGLAAERPLLAAAFTILLLAQAGVPFTTGFLAKLSVVEAALASPNPAGVTLTAIAMISTAIAAYFYLRLVVLTYAGRAPSSDLAGAPAARLAAIGVGVLVEDDRDGAVERFPGVSATTDGATLDADPNARPRIEIPAATAVVLVCCVVPTVLFGIWAGPLTDLATKASMIFSP